MSLRSVFLATITVGMICLSGLVIYLERGLGQARARLEQTKSALQTELDEARSNVAAIENRLKELNQELDRERAARAKGQEATELFKTALESQRAVSDQLQQALTKSESERTAAGLANAAAIEALKSAHARQLAEAVSSTTPTPPVPTRIEEPARPTAVAPINAPVPSSSPTPSSPSRPSVPSSPPPGSLTPGPPTTPTATPVQPPKKPGAPPQKAVKPKPETGASQEGLWNEGG